MDVQTLEVSLGFPRLPRTDGFTRQRTPTPAAGPGNGRASGVATSQAALLAYTAATIVAGLGALAWTTMTVPVLPAIDTGLDGTVLGNANGGVLLWIALGLVGSLKVLPAPGGLLVWTFHFPFIAAAMALGGPTAGAWVAFLSTLERRELESQPWYGALANHAATAFAAVVGGLTVLVLDGALGSRLADRHLATLIATGVGTLVLALVANAIAAGTVILREHLSAVDLVELLVRAFGRITIAEIGLAWVFTVAYVAVGWWAPLALAVIILAVWPQADAEGPDPLTKLPRLRAFERSLDGMIGRIRRGIAPGGLLLAIDLDKFGPINKDPKLGFAVGNEVLCEIGRRLREQIRATDLAARPGGDEFGAFFAGAFDDEGARRLARRVEASIRRPILTSAGVVEVGASIGVVIVTTASAVADTRTLMRQADATMQVVKKAGGGVRLHEAQDDVGQTGPSPEQVGG